jgi:hypothetical protein
MLHTKFPREIRDMVYRAMYVQDRPILTDKLLYIPGKKDYCSAYCLDWPEDITRYLSHTFVGKKTAREAAEAFYGGNTFVVSQVELLSRLFNHDHYKSSVVPSRHIQKLVVVITYMSTFIWTDDWTHKHRVVDNAAYLGVRNPLDREQNDRRQLRHHLRALDKFLEGSSTSKEVSIYVRLNSTNDRFDPRIVAEQVFLLKENGVKVTVRTGCRKMEALRYSTNAETREGQGWDDITSYYDEATEAEKALFKHPHSAYKREISSSGEVSWIFSFPCSSDDPTCREHSSSTCSDHAWHAGWYRALVNEYMDMRKDLGGEDGTEPWGHYEGEKEGENENEEEGEGVATVCIRVPKPDPSHEYDADGEKIHGESCPCWGYGGEDADSKSIRWTLKTTSTCENL